MMHAGPGNVNGTPCADRVGDMTDTPATPRRRGAARTEELLRVTLDLAAEVGYAGLSIEAVARRAGVGKHTIYRRWPSIAALLLDALSLVWTSDLDYRNAGDVHADLREQFIRSSVALSNPPIGPVYRAVIAEAQADSTLRATLHERFLATVEQSTLDRLTSAQRAGELAADVDLEFAAEVLCGTLYYRWLLSTRPVDEAAVDGLLDMFMAAYQTR
jgi:AcrR family transcriptional regulator